MVTRIPLLAPDECDRAVERVEANRDAWTRRHPVFPFYTLGAASYLDAGFPREGYYRTAADLNPLLEREFGWLHRRVLAAVGEHVGVPAAFAPRAALPGFHVFLAHEAFRRPLGRIHFDLQFRDLEWDRELEVDFTRPVSFTLAVRLPAAGAGLRTWNLSKAEFDALGPEAPETVDREHPAGYVAYRAGELVCHSGLLLHQIAPATDAMRPDDMRVTLQGHALLGSGTCWVYW